MYVGAEFSFGAFLTSFCVLGPLKLQRAEGAKVTSVYYAAQGAAKGAFGNSCSCCKLAIEIVVVQVVVVAAVAPAAFKFDLVVVVA